jgi:hypothetical protein
MSHGKEGTKVVKYHASILRDPSPFYIFLLDKKPNKTPLG